MTARRSRGRLVICVADTGIGIAKQDHGRIFEGLTLTRRWVELHGGRIWV